MKFIKLSKWAKENDYTYTGAWLLHKRDENELADDLIAVVTSFCAKLYGKTK